MNFQLKTDTSIEQRKQDAENIRIRYPERVPVIIERVPGSQILDIRNQKFLAPCDITMGQLIWILRKWIHLSAEDALFVFVQQRNQGMFRFTNNLKQSWTIPQLNSTMGTIYTEYKDEDGFLYIAYAGENVFGS